MNSKLGPGRSGWSGSFPLFSVEGEKSCSCVHVHEVRITRIYNVGEYTRTTRTHLDLSLLSKGVRQPQTRTLPGPKPFRPGPCPLATGDVQ